MRDETVWLNVKQMAELFGREKSNIIKHTINIFKENNNGQNLPVDDVKQKMSFIILM